MDNFNELRSVIFARNASFNIAKELGYTYFIQLDDDYGHFQYRFDSEFKYNPRAIKNLGFILERLVDFYANTPAITSLAVAQGGDFIGGKDCRYAQNLTMFRKAMNLFICSTDRSFKFLGILNDDVNTYTYLTTIGDLFFTCNQLTLEQGATQANDGGLTDIYIQFGTYVKSFYTVMLCPSSTIVTSLNTTHSRLHHQISWENVAPKILREEYRKQRYGIS
jgi:hypothetical protein